MIRGLYVIALVGCGAATSTTTVTIPRDVPTSATAPVASSAAAPSTSGAWKSPPAAAVIGSPRNTIVRMLALLQRRDFEELFQTFVDPADLKKLTDTRPLDDVIATFVRQEKDKDLVLLLVHARDKAPEINSVDHIATYEKDGDKTIRFHEVDGRWYVMDD